MILNKTAITLFLIDLSVKAVASTSTKSTQMPSPSGKSAFQRGKHVRAPKLKKIMLKDKESTVNDVEVQKTGIEEIDVSQKRVVPKVNKEFERLINNRKYMEVFALGKKMKSEEFLKQLYLVVKTYEQYKRFVGYLKNHKMMASFYVHGNIKVVKEAIVESRVYDFEDYINDGDLETALPLALEEDSHDRVIELFRIRKGITSEADEHRRQRGDEIGFDVFVSDFLNNLAPWNDGMPLKRFLTFHRDKLRNKHPDILDTLCQELVFRLNHRLDNPNAEKLLVDLVGQPSLLTPVSFAKGFLYAIDDKGLSAFIDYSWDEAIEEGLKKTYFYGGEELWRILKKKHLNRFSGECPLTAVARAVVRGCFPTKQQREEQWIKKSAIILLNKLKSLEPTLDLLPGILWSIITEYAILWTDI